MYGQLRQRPGNLFFSPFSIRTALGMTQAGARGETAAQMREALRISSSDETLHVAFAEIIQRLNAAGGGEYEMAVANSLWGQDGAPLQPGFLDLIARHYGGGMNLVDFRRGAEAARVAMNRWVEDKTRQKIRELIPSGGLDADTRLVLVNAVYFKGMWVLQFRRAATRDEPFHLEGGGTGAGAADAPARRGPVPEGRQATRRSTWSTAAATCPCSCFFRTRRTGFGISRKGSPRACSTTAWRRWVSARSSSSSPGSRSLGEPSTCATSSTALGMPLAFNRFQADFSGINGHEPPHEESLFISAVFHKAFVEVERGGDGGRGRHGGSIGHQPRPLRPGRRQFPSSEPTIPSCSPSAIGRAVRSCFSGA